MTVHVIEALEFIETFNFRELCSITIPKAVRERAVDLAIDVEIVSVARQQYLSYSSMPANGSYGYVVIVLQDFCEIEIELSQARQRIYLWHSQEAYANRYAIELADLNFLAHLTTQQIACQVLSNLLGFCIESPTPSIPKVLWKETPIREIYVKTHYGTTFRVEVSHNKFTPYQMLSTGDILDMKSGWNDGEKDQGLPISGSQPQTASNANDPYSGFPIPSTNEELGDYANAKIDFADNPNSDNTQVIPVIRWAVAYTGEYFLQGVCNNVYEFFALIGSGYNAAPLVTNTQIASTFKFCNIYFYYITISINGVKIVDATSNRPIGISIIEYIEGTEPIANFYNRPKV
jgi:hypothetical protein